jgi:NADP-dependent 3-hydroxy acid dehydrogenase YdfG
MPKTWKHAFVTGASSGLGEALALELSRGGTAVTLCARRVELLEGLAERIRKAGGHARAAVLDVTRASDVRKAVEEAEAELGPIDLVVANAGLGINSPAGKIRTEWIDQMIDINLKGAMYTVVAILPGMLERGSGNVVGVSSLAGYRGMPGSAVYSASKAGLSTFLEAIRAEAGERGVVVTDVCPGFIKTQLTAKNRFPMPFLMDADTAARRIVSSVRAGRARYGFPWPMHALMRLVQSIPRPIYDFVGRRIAKTLEPRPKSREGGGARV